MKLEELPAEFRERIDTHDWVPYVNGPFPNPHKVVCSRCEMMMSKGGDVRVHSKVPGVGYQSAAYPSAVCLCEQCLGIILPERVRTCNEELMLKVIG